MRTPDIYHKGFSPLHNRRNGRRHFAKRFAAEFLKYQKDVKMMNLRQQVKHNAKEAMRSHYGKAVAIFLILFAVGMIFFLFNALFIRILNMQSFSQMFLYRVTIFGVTSIVNIAEPIVCLVSAVFAFIVITPLLLGITRWYYHLTDGKADEVSSIFDYYVSGRMFFRSLWFAWHMGVRRVFWYLLFMRRAVRCFPFRPGCTGITISTTKTL